MIDLVIKIISEAICGDGCYPGVWLPGPTRRRSHGGVVD